MPRAGVIHCIRLPGAILTARRLSLPGIGSIAPVDGWAEPGTSVSHIFEFAYSVRKNRTEIAGYGATDSRRWYLSRRDTGVSQPGSAAHVAPGTGRCLRLAAFRVACSHARAFIIDVRYHLRFNSSVPGQHLGALEGLPPDGSSCWNEPITIHLPSSARAFAATETTSAPARYRAPASIRPDLAMQDAFRLDCRSREGISVEYGQRRFSRYSPPFGPPALPTRASADQDRQSTSPPWEQVEQTSPIAWRAVAFVQAT